MKTRDRVKSVLAGIAVSAVVIALFAATVWYGIERKKQWKSFTTANECRLIRRQDSALIQTTTVTVNASGQAAPSVGTAVLPGSTTWLCKDGIEYVHTE